MKLLFDENLSARLVRDLADLYPESSHVINRGLGGERDAAIWARAAALQLTTDPRICARFAVAFDFDSLEVALEASAENGDPMRTLIMNRHRARTLAFSFGAVVMPLALGAQSVSVELKAGSNRSRQVGWCCGESNPFDSRLGFTAGAAASIRLWGPVGLQSEALYTQKGIRGPDSFAMRLDYIETPILIRVTDRGSRPVRAVALVGVAPAFEVSCAGRTRPFSAPEVVPPVGPLDCNNYRDRRWDFGLVGALGADVRLGSRTLTAELRYTQGVSDLTAEYNFARTTNRSLAVLVGFRAGRW